MRLASWIAAYSVLVTCSCVLEIVEIAAVKGVKVAWDGTPKTRTRPRKVLRDSLSLNDLNQNGYGMYIDIDM